MPGKCGFSCDAKVKLECSFYSYPQFIARGLISRIRLRPFGLGPDVRRRWGLEAFRAEDARVWVTMTYSVLLAIACSTKLLVKVADGWKILRMKCDLSS